MTLPMSCGPINLPLPSFLQEEKCPGSQRSGSQNIHEDVDAEVPEVDTVKMPHIFPNKEAFVPTAGSTVGSQPALCGESPKPKSHAFPGGLHPMTAPVEVLLRTTTRASLVSKLAMGSAQSSPHPHHSFAPPPAHSRWHPLPSIGFHSYVCKSI